MSLYLVGFSGKLGRHAEAARVELRKWGATRLWDDTWIVDMENDPETCLPGLVQTEAAFSLCLEGSNAFFSISRAAGVAAQLAYTEKIAPLLHPVEDTEDLIAQVRYCNNGKAVFQQIVAQYMWQRRHSVWATDLCHLMANYGSDKGIGWHTYTPFYQELFRDRREDITSAFELGLGTNNEDVPSNMGRCGNPGASLRAWREYFPNAQIYGADVDERILFSEDRIQTFFVDQCRPDTFRSLWENIPCDGFDLFLDDGLHTYDAAKITFENAVGKVNKGGYYIIEDVPTSSSYKYLDMADEAGFDGMSIIIAHPTNIYDNCLVIISV